MDMWHGEGEKGLRAHLGDVSPSHPNYLGARHLSIHITFNRERGKFWSELTY